MKLDVLDILQLALLEPDRLKSKHIQAYACRCAIDEIKRLRGKIAARKGSDILAMIKDVMEKQAAVKEAEAAVREAERTAANLQPHQPC